MNMRWRIWIAVLSALIMAGLACWDDYSTRRTASLNIERIGIFAAAFREALEPLKPGWTVVKNEIRGPQGAVIRFVERHAEGDSHVDVDFEADAGNPASLRLLDCASGIGSTLADKAKYAAKLWSSTTGAALLELKYSGTGEFASHYRESDPKGLLGWHAINSPITGFGDIDKANTLQRWWLDHELILPALSSALADLNPKVPHGIKILFGGEDVAEVRVDGEFHEQASKALSALEWPKGGKPAFVRAYVIAIHPDRF